MIVFALLATLMTVAAAAFVAPAFVAGKGEGRRTSRGWLVAAAIPLAAALLYWKVGTPRAMESLRAEVPAIPRMDVAQARLMVERLARRLDSTPDDAAGWRMLARSYEALGNYDDAAEAYAHLRRLTPDDAHMLTDYAVTLGIARGQGLAGEPEALLRHALEIDPDNVEALALLGSAAFDRGDRAGAVAAWGKVLSLVPPDSEVAASIKASIAKVKGRE
jgi:cytochrome c-type biogenesis protein CcmH